MRRADSPPGRLPCLWMTAGLLSYRLCDREYDCDRCPLDAALRGPGSTATVPAPPAAGGGGARAPARNGGDFPADRRYGAGHTWLRPAGDGAPGRFRVGLDGLAAALLAAPRAVRCAAAGRLLAPGETACELDLEGGVLALGLPVAGEVVAANAACRRDPSLVVADPYGDGWLLEIALPAAGDGWLLEIAAPAAGAGCRPGCAAAASSPAGATASTPRLLPAAEARRRAGHDLRRFRRRVALDLLAADDGVGATLPDGGEPLLDLRALLGARRHLELVRELVR
jgi:glycine cleavage system H protein